MNEKLKANYRQRSDIEGKTCWNCAFFKEMRGFSYVGECKKHDFRCRVQGICDDHQPKEVIAGVVQPPKQ